MNQRINSFYKWNISLFASHTYHTNVKYLLVTLSIRKFTYFIPRYQYYWYIVLNMVLCEKCLVSTWKVDKIYFWLRYGHFVFCRYIQRSSWWAAWKSMAVTACFLCGSGLYKMIVHVGGLCKGKGTCCFPASHRLTFEMYACVLITYLDIWNHEHVAHSDPM